MSQESPPSPCEGPSDPGLTASSRDLPTTAPGGRRLAARAAPRPEARGPVPPTPSRQRPAPHSKPWFPSPAAGPPLQGTFVWFAAPGHCASGRRRRHAHVGRRVLFKLWKIEGKEKILKEARGKHLSHRETGDSHAAFSTETRREPSAVDGVAGEKATSHQPGALCPGTQSSKREREIKALLRQVRTEEICCRETCLPEQRAEGRGQVFREKEIL